jgi:hypothetical protein
MTNSGPLGGEKRFRCTSRNANRGTCSDGLDRCRRSLLTFSQCKLFAVHKRARQTLVLTTSRSWIDKV